MDTIQGIIHITIRSVNSTVPCSHQGPICADEISVNMRTNYMIKYDFKGRYKSTIAERIHVGFTTTDPKGFLLGAFSDISQEYLTLMVSNSGHIRDQ